MNRRRILLAVAAGLVLVIGGLAIAVAVIPENRVARAVAQRAESVLGEPVSIDGVGISLLPLPGVRLSGVSVGQPDSSAFARVERAELRVRLLPLFQRRIVIGKLDLERPRIAVQIDSAGIANLPVVERDSTAEPPARDISFAVDRIRVSDGEISYVNLDDGARVHLDGWNQQLRVAGTVQEGALASLDLTGWVAFDNVDADLPDAVLPARDLSVRLDHDASLDLQRDRLELRTLEVGIDGVTVGGSGRVEGVNSGRPQVALDLEAEGLDASRLMGWVPDSLRARLALNGRPLALRGTAALRATVEGTIAPDTLPSVDGFLYLANVAVVAEDEALVDAIGGTVAFSTDSVVARFDGLALGESFNGGVAVRNPAAPVAVVAISGHGELGRLAALGLVPDSLGLSGGLRVDLRAQIPVDAPATSEAAGSVELANLRLTGLDPAIGIPSVNAHFEGRRVRVAPSRVQLGADGTAVEVGVTADGWIPAAVGAEAPPPRIVATIDGETVDLDALLGPSESRYPSLLFARLGDRSIQGRTPEDVAGELGIALPPLPPLDARIEARIDQLVRNELRYSDLEADLEVTQTAVAIEHLRFGLMGGTVEASGRLEPLPADSGAESRARFMGRFALTNVGAGPFFDALTPFREHLTGRMDLIATVGMDLDRYALPERNSVDASGALAIAEGRLANWTVLQGVADRLGIAAFDTLWFQDWAGSFRIDGPRVTLEETALQGRRLAARAAGWFDFGGRLDVGAATDLSEELARQASAIGEEILAATQGGGVPVGLRIQGSVERPSVALDLSPVREAIAARVQDAAQEARSQVEANVRAAADTARAQLEEEIRGRLEGATGQTGAAFQLPDSLRGLPADSLRVVLGDSVYALLPDSVKLRADSLQNAIQNALQRRLRRLLPGGGGDEGGGGGGSDGLPRPRGDPLQP
jgi:hypothetical protein